MRAGIIHKYILSLVWAFSREGGLFKGEGGGLTMLANCLFEALYLQINCALKGKINYTTDLKVTNCNGHVLVTLTC